MKNGSYIFLVKSEKWKVKSEKSRWRSWGLLAINKTTKQQNNQTTSFLVKNRADAVAADN